MNIELLILIIIIVLLLICLQGYFCGAETIFTSVNRLFLQRKKEDGNLKAAKALEFATNPERFLATTLVGTNITLAATSSLFKLVVSEFPLGEHDLLINILNSLILTPVIVVFAEMLPKSTGRSNANKFAIKISNSLWLAEIIMKPFVWAISITSSKILNLMGVSTDGNLLTMVSREDLRSATALFVKEDGTKKEVGDMLHSVFAMQDTVVSSVMSPLVNIVSISLTAQLKDVEEMSIKYGFSRIPVFDKRVDNFVGIVDIRRLIGATMQGEIADKTIADFLDTDIMFIPETKSVGSLLHELRYHQIPLAIVVDEHGGSIGIVTAEDLIEEVVGEIHDERDKAEVELVKIAETEFILNGKMEIRDFQKSFDITIESDDNFETIAGLILKLTGEIPNIGDIIPFQNNHIFEILELENHRIIKVRFQISP